MRLSEIYVECKKTYKNISGERDFLNDNVSQDDFNIVKIITIQQSLNNILDACQKLKNIGGIRYYLEKIEKSLDKGEILKIEILSTVDNLRTSIWTIMRFLKSIGIKEKNIGLDIKMPTTDNITDLKKYVDDLEFIFTKCPFFKDDKESLKLEGVDIGSVWLVLAVSGITVGTATAVVTSGSVLLNNIAAFIDKCYIIKSHKLTCEQQKMEIERSKADQKRKEEMIETIEKIYQISVNNAISDLEEITNIEVKDNDERSLVEQSFNRLGALIDKGLQIHSAIGSPEEVKAVFAPIEMRYLTTKDNISKIEDKSDE